MKPSPDLRASRGIETPVDVAALVERRSLVADQLPGALVGVDLGDRGRAHALEDRRVLDLLQRLELFVRR